MDFPKVRNQVVGLGIGGLIYNDGLQCRRGAADSDHENRVPRPPVVTTGLVPPARSLRCRFLKCDARYLRLDRSMKEVCIQKYLVPISSWSEVVGAEDYFELWDIKQEPW